MNTETQISITPNSRNTETDSGIFSITDALRQSRERYTFMAATLYLTCGLLYQFFVIREAILVNCIIISAGALLILFAYLFYRAKKINDLTLALFTFLSLGVGISSTMAQLDPSLYQGYALNFAVLLSGSAFYLLWDQNIAIITGLIQLVVLVLIIPSPSLIPVEAAIIVFISLCNYIVGCTFQYSSGQRIHKTNINLFVANSELYSANQKLTGQLNDLNIFKRVLDNSSDGVIIFDLSLLKHGLSQIIYENNNFLNCLDFTLAKNKSERLIQFLNRILEARQKNSNNLQTALRLLIDECKDNFTLQELEMQKADGSSCYLSVSFSVVYQGSLPVRLAIFARDFTSTKLSDREAYTQKVASYLNVVGKINDVQETERKKFSIELHDGIGQLLTAAKINMSFLVSQVQSEYKELAEVSQQLLEASIAEMRNIVYDILPPSLYQFGLLSAVEEMCRKSFLNNTTSISFTTTLRKLDLPSRVALQLYRIVQEGTQNILKHSQAKTAGVKIWAENNFLFLEIHDDGIGYDSTLISRRHGLNNIKTRSDLLGADLQVESHRNQGTSIKLKLKLHQTQLPEISN